MLITTISFPGNCEEAINFYKEAVNAEVKGIHYVRDAPPNSGMDESLPPNFVMHSEVMISGTLVYMTDGGEKQITGENFGFALAFDTAEEVTSAFNKLANGGKIVGELSQQFWATLCGSVEDRFGVSWHILTNN